MCVFQGAGSSSNWCSDTYRGDSANSEPEAQAVIAAVAEAGDVRSYLSIHSYSQLLLVPHAYAAIKAPDYNELVNFPSVEPIYTVYFNRNVFMK